MRPSRLNVATKRASATHSKAQEDEKASKEKRKVAAKEEEKTKLLHKNHARTSTVKTSSSSSSTPRNGPLKATARPNVKPEEALRTSIKPGTNIRTKRPPLTPPSKRVTKTQFFSSSSKTTPQKSSDSLSTGSSTRSTDKTVSKSKSITDSSRSSQKGVTDSRKAKSDRPNVKEFIKKVREENKKKERQVEEPETKRPGTATLTNPVVLKNIAQQGTGSETTTEQSTASEDIDYEDDFDSYESDFESESSSSAELADGMQTGSSSDDSDSLSLPNATATPEDKRIHSDEEKTLDSGTFDLPEQKYKQVLQNIKESMVESENRVHTNPASLPDEGFEEVKSLGNDNGCFINFTDAQRKLKQSKTSAKRRKRGEELLSMIKLDSYSFTLFDLAPMSYERYIKLYGQKNCVQASSQTGDDNVDEECQTEDVITSNKWTQAPVAFSKIDVSQPNYLNIYKSECMGAGSDEETDTNENVFRCNDHHYNKFLRSAGQLLLTLLQENSSQSLKELQHSEFPTFSSGYIECNTETIPLLKNTVVTNITYNSTDSSQFLTVHKQKQISQDSFKDILCTWYLSDLNQPERIFVSYGEVTCCCLNHADSKIVFAGSADGNVSVWSCYENRSSRNFFVENTSESQPQVPQYMSEVGLGHVSKVVSIQPVFSESQVKKSGLDDTNQLCTLDQEGMIIFWSIINKATGGHGRSIVLSQNSKVVLNTLGPDSENIQSTSMTINKLDPNHLFVSTSLGYVVHTLISGTTTHPKKYYPPMTSEVTCLAACPFSELYFLAGFGNGYVTLYSRMVEKPLLVMINKNSESGVEQIEWSCSKPCVFYVKHQENTLDIWDLTISDMLPAYSVPFREGIKYVKVIPTTEKYKNASKSCMIIGYDSGQLQLHILSKEHGQNSSEEFRQDVKKFLNYVNRL